MQIYIGQIIARYHETLDFRNLFNTNIQKIIAKVSTKY